MRRVFRVGSGKTERVFRGRVRKDLHALLRVHPFVSMIGETGSVSD
jgi:hypothetical protein